MSLTSKLDLSPNKVTYTWIVENASTKTGYYYSPTFSLPSNELTLFRLLLNVNFHYFYWGNQRIVINIHLHSSNKDYIKAHCQLSILNSKGEKWNPQGFQVNFAKIPKFLELSGQYSLFQDYVLNPANGLVVDDKLTIYCEMELIDDIEQVLPVSTNKSNLHQMSADYETFLTNDKLADVVFHVGGTELKAHKTILSARSSVFAAMFEHDCKEKLDNVVEITDMSVEAFEELLRYIYCGKIRALDQFAVELLAASDKYQIDCLKSACGQYLTSNLATETVSVVLLIADLHQEDELKTKCIDFITDNASKVMASESWKALTTKPELLADLFKNMAIKTGR